MNRLLRLWRRPLVYRTAIGLYVTLVLALAGIIFSVNTLDVQSAVYLRADTQLETDRTHATRGTFHYAPTGERLYPESMRWQLQPADQTDDSHRDDLEFVHGDPADTWPTPTFRLPDDIEDGTYDLRLTATHEQISTLDTTHRIDVVDRGVPAKSFDEFRWPRPDFRDDEGRHRSVVERVDDHEIVFQLDETDVAEEARRVGLAVAPSTGELIRGLPQKLFVRTFDADDGRPVSADLTLDVVDGMLEGTLDSTISTDAQGIGVVEIRPATGIDIEVKVEPDDDYIPAVFEMSFDAIAAQYALEPTARIVTPGDEIEAAVHGTLPDGTFMGDLYDFEGDRFLDALALRMSDGRSGLRFAAPRRDEASLLLRLQTYQSLYGTKHAWDSSYVVFVEDDSTDALRDLVAELYEWIGDKTGSDHHRHLADPELLEELSDRQLRRLVDAGLEEIPRTFELPPVLLNTRDADREALDVWREDVKRDLHLMMGITIFVGIIVVLYFVVVGIRRHRRDHALIRELSLEGELPDEEQRKAERLERYAVALQGLIVLLTLIAFAIGILMMVSYL